MAESDQGCWDCTKLSSGSVHSGRGLVATDLVLALLFGRVHCSVSLFHQFLAGQAIISINRDTDAQGDPCHHVTKQIGRTDRRKHPLGDHTGTGGLIQPAQQYRELVPTESRGTVLFIICVFTETDFVILTKN